MSDIRYRAILVDPGNLTPERPIQTFANSPESVDDWARAHLSRTISEESRVDVFTVVETLTRRITRIKQTPRDPHGRCALCSNTGIRRDAPNGGALKFCECQTGADLQRVEARGK